MMLDRNRPTHSALAEVAAERQRQIEVEGWTADHDTRHTSGSLAMAAALYAAPEPLYRVTIGSGTVRWSDPWPWISPCWAGREQAGDPMLGTRNDGDGRNKHGRRRQLVIAGALILAEIERIDRSLKPSEANGG